MPYKDKAKKTEADKRYYDAHKEEIAKYKREYDQKHKEERAKYRQEHKEELAIKKKGYRATYNGVKFNLLYTAEERARKKKIPLPFDLTDEWFDKNYKGVCEISGMPLRLNGPPGDLYRPSIDRIDSSKGYTQDNCQIVALFFNLGKSNASNAVVKTLLHKYVLIHQIKLPENEFIIQTNAVAKKRMEKDPNNTIKSIDFIRK